MKNYITLLLLLGIYKTYSQVRDTLNIRQHSIETSYVYTYEGVFFFPKKDLDNTPDSTISFCENHSSLFIVRGLELSERQFLELGLKSRDIDEDNCFYVYRRDDLKSCVGKTIFDVSLDIPIEYNSLKVESTHQKEKLKNIDIEKVKLLKIKRCLFRKDKLVINTN